MTEDQTQTSRKSPRLTSTSDYIGELRAGLVVFLVALPLCLGIALASGAPLVAGLITGMVGGLVVAPFGGSSQSVSGPAAGLIVLVSQGITDMGDWSSFTAAVVVCGLLQLLFGALRMGRVGEFFPTSVIKGMLSAIGIVIILKQIPHALGRDIDPEGDLAFIGVMGKNSLTEIVIALNNVHPSALTISVLSLAILLLWPLASDKIKTLSWIPAQLVVVLAAVGFHELLIGSIFPDMTLSRAAGHMVDLPVATTLKEASSFIIFPKIEAFILQKTWILGAVLAAIATLETLLSVEAVDKLDPYRRISNTNKELYAQGLGNVTAGFLGGLPMTAVIVRSSANVYAGGKTTLASFIHGIFLFIAVIILPRAMNQIPIAALAAILIQIGYKLSHPKLFKDMYQRGPTQFTPFIVTIVSVVVSDLLTGVLIGFAVGVYFVIKANRHATITVVQDGNDFLMRFNKDMSFMDRAELKEHLLSIPDNANLLIDGLNSQYVDQDILDVLNDFENSAYLRGIEVQLIHLHSNVNI